MELVAGVDLSTQSCKVVVRDSRTGVVVRSGRAGHPDGTEVDPNAWWTALSTALDDAGGLEDVAAISIGAQQHGMIALDSEGAVVRPALLWNDVRSAQASLDLVAEFGADELARRGGSLPLASFTLAKLRWLRDAEPENAARVAAVALPHDWLTWRMRGFGPRGLSPHGPQLDELTTDRSDVTGTGYWSPTHEDYDRDLLAAAIGRDLVLPRVLTPQEASGTTAAQGSIPAGIPIGAGAGDNAAAALALDLNPGDVVVSLGTSGTVFAATDSPVVDASGAIAGFADATGRWLPLIATLNAARNLDAIARVLGVDHFELGRLALAAEPGSAGLVLVPYFEGERTPNLPDATATLSGMTLASTTRENLARAAIEGTLCGLAAGLDALLSHGVTAERILLIGGAAQNPAVSCIAAEVFGLPVVVPEPGEYVALGAARQAAWMLTSSLPAWPVALAATADADPRPVIRSQYALSARGVMGT